MFSGSALPEAGLCQGCHNSLLGHAPRPLRHWIALLLCSEKRPVRKGQIVPRGDMEAAKYLSCGRNIVQQETEFRKGQRN